MSLPGSPMAAWFRRKPLLNRIPSTSRCCAHRRSAPALAIPELRGRTIIAAAIAEQSGIKVQAAAAGVIAESMKCAVADADRGARRCGQCTFPGPIRSLRANVGDHIRAGQTLATIESNLSLSTYNIAAPISGWSPRAMLQLATRQ